jgi:hypothetical protein
MVACVRVAITGGKCNIWLADGFLGFEVRYLRYYTYNYVPGSDHSAARDSSDSNSL